MDQITSTYVLIISIFFIFLWLFCRRSRVHSGLFFHWSSRLAFAGGRFDPHSSIHRNYHQNIQVIIMMIIMSLYGNNEVDDDDHKAPHYNVDGAQPVVMFIMLTIYT